MESSKFAQNGMEKFLEKSKLYIQTFGKKIPLKFQFQTELMQFILHLKDMEQDSLNP